MSDSNETSTLIYKDFDDFCCSCKEALDSKTLKAAIENMSAEISSSGLETPDEAASTENSESEDKSVLLNAKSVLTELDSTKPDYIIKTGHNHEVYSSLRSMNEDDPKLAISNIRKTMKEAELLLEKSLKISSSFLKSLPKSLQHSTISSMERMQENSNNATLSMYEGQSKMCLEVLKPLEHKYSNSSGCFSLPISSKSATHVSVAESSDIVKRSLTSNSGKTLLTDRPPAYPWENINNSFCYSFITQMVRGHYNTLFDFAEFKHACSMNSNAYRKFLSIKYILLPLSRYLMEDLLDFVDFLNGTEIELREPDSNSEDRKLAFVRENFAIGVQQLEFRPLSNLLEELNNYYEQSKAIKEPSNPDKIVNAQGLPDSIESQQGKVLSDPEVTPECSDLGKKPSKLHNFISLERYRIFRLEPEIENLYDPYVAERLGALNDAIKRLTLRCISDARMILDVCIDTKYNVLTLRLIRYFSGIESLLHRLVLLREDSCKLLGNWDRPVDNAKTLHILRVKLQVASAFRKLLLTFSEINSEFLDH